MYIDWEPILKLFDGFGPDGNDGIWDEAGFNFWRQNIYRDPLLLPYIWIDRGKLSYCRQKDKHAGAHISQKA